MRSIRQVVRKRKITGLNQLWATVIMYGTLGKDRFFFIMSIFDLFDRVDIDYHTGLACNGTDAAFILSRARAKENLRKGWL